MSSTDALAAAFSAVQVGDPFDTATQMGPLAMERQRDRVEHYIAKGIEEGATLVAGGGRPKHLKRGYYIEPTVFASVDNKHVIAQEEIFGPVLSVIPADNERTRGRDRQRHDLRAQRGGLHTGCGAGSGGCRPTALWHCGTQRYADRHRTLRSAASSSPASAGRAAGKGCCRILETKTILLDETLD